VEATMKRRREGEDVVAAMQLNAQPKGAAANPKKKAKKVPILPGRLFVGGLPAGITPEALEQLITPFGIRVERVELNPKHSAFVGTHLNK